MPEFEKAVSSRVCAKHGVAANSATSALHIACLALGLGPGDRLWTSPITFVASANCGRYCGAEIDFVDIDRSTGLISVAKLEEKLSDAARKGTLPKVIVPVHLCGTSCNMAAIGQLAEEYEVTILEDASHAIGGQYEGRPVGNCHYSKISIFSFHPVKIITTGEGGMATTNEGKLAQRMQDLRSHGITKDKNRFKTKNISPWTYEQQDLGFNYRLSDIQAALGLSQLARLDEILRERKILLEIYRQNLATLPLQFLEIPSNVDSSLHLAVVRLIDRSAEYHRYIFEELRRANIGVQLHYSPVHLQPYYQKLGFAEGDYPEAEAYASSAISLPLYPGLKSREQQKVVEVLNQKLKA